MKRTFTLTVPTATLIALAVGITPAAATDCTPTDAIPAVPATYATAPNPDHVPEHAIVHPAIGDPTITVVDVPAWTETIEHPAVTETVEHPAVEEVTERRWFVWTGGPTTKTPPVDSEHWNPASGNPSGKPHQQPDGTPYKVGKGKGDWFLWLTVVVTPGHPAWTETITVTEAWTETIEHPAVYVTVPNPDHVPEWVEIFPAVGEPLVEVMTDPGSPAVPAVECPTVPDVEPDAEDDVRVLDAATDRTPATARTGDRAELAETGIDAAHLTLAAFAMVGLGGSIAVLRRGRHEVDS